MIKEYGFIKRLIKKLFCCTECHNIDILLYDINFPRRLYSVPVPLFCMYSLYNPLSHCLWNQSGHSILTSGASKPQTR